jgi:putative spermidine/putrescine transport system ATP-binding protein/spermidine/putrescine transport system ATP-binding protein
MLTIENVTHKYGSVTALDGVSLNASQGEFLTVLGESGSGKTTLLRVISGLEKPTYVDRIEIDGQDVSNVPAARRNCTTVFQNYALFPHMSVQENVEYGLSVRGVSRENCRQLAQDTLNLVRLSAKGDRRISQLSGGEQQRVALARALVTQPAILLLDEPLGALDEKLRQDMQAELVDLHRQLGMTFIYITHSQEEALTMSDRIILMRQGQVAQSGQPEELFDKPNSRFCADFMGFENILPAVVEKISGSHVMVTLGKYTVRGVWSGSQAPQNGQRVFVAIRAERLRIGFAAEAGVTDNQLSCTPGSRLYRGKYIDQVAETPLGEIRTRIWDRALQFDDFDCITWRADDCVITAD